MMTSVSQHISNVLFHSRNSKVFQADLQILAAACLFGVSFIVQREVSLEGLDSMTCNTIRFGLSYILLILCGPFLPKTPELIHKNSHNSTNHTKSITFTHNELPLSSNNHDLICDEEECYLITSEELNIVQPSPLSNKIKKSSNKQHTVTNNNYHNTCFYRLSSYFPAFPITWYTSTLYWGILLGLCNLIASSLQQYALLYTTANKVAFINGLDIFFTPVLMYFIFQKSISKITWFAIGISLIGLFLLSNPTSEHDNTDNNHEHSLQNSSNNHSNIVTSPKTIFTVLFEPIWEFFLFVFSCFSGEFGAFLVLLSTFFWSANLILTDVAFTHFPIASSTSINFLCEITSIQCLVVTIGCLFMILVCEYTFTEFTYLFLNKVEVFFWPMLLLSAMETVGMLLLAKGQNYAPPAHAAILLCLEGVFTTIGSFIFLPNESLHIYEWIGCVLILVGVMVATYYEDLESEQHQHVEDREEDDDDIDDEASRENDDSDVDEKFKYNRNSFKSTLMINTNASMKEKESMFASNGCAGCYCWNNILKRFWCSQQPGIICGWCQNNNYYPKRKEDDGVEKTSLMTRIQNLFDFFRFSSSSSSPSSSLGISIITTNITTTPHSNTASLSPTPLLTTTTTVTTPHHLSDYHNHILEEESLYQLQQQQQQQL